MVDSSLGSMTCPSCGGRSDDGILCQPETDAYEHNLAQIPGLWVELEITLTRQSKTGGDNTNIKHTKGNVAALPYELHASEVASNTRNRLAYWFRELFGVRSFADVPFQCEVFTESRNRIRGHEDAGLFAAELCDLVTDMRNTIDLRPDTVYLGPCDNLIGRERCKYQMYAKAGVESFDCPGVVGRRCGKVYNVARRQAELLELVRDLSDTVSGCVKVLATFGVHVKYDTVFHWAKPSMQRGVTYPPKVWATGRNENGDQVYRIGDVEQLAKDAAGRRTQRKTGSRAVIP